MIITVAVAILLVLYVAIRLYPSISRTTTPVADMAPVADTAPATATPTPESKPDNVADSSKDNETKEEEAVNTDETTEDKPDNNEPALRFRNRKLLNDHFEKHGRDMGFASAEEYEKAAAVAAANPNALHKIESDDGDDVYYVEATNEFVVVSTDGYIRTYFLPDSGIKYFNKQ